MAATPELSKRVRRAPPTVGLRPTVIFALEFACTIGWVAFSVWVSDEWRGELEDAIGPVAGWLIPTLMAYIPGLVIWFMIFTLVFARYHEPPVGPPAGPWQAGGLPA